MEQVTSVKLAGGNRRAGYLSRPAPVRAAKCFCRHTSIGVGLGSVTVLQSVGPRAVVFGRGSERLADTVAAFESLRPFASVNPPAARFDAQSVPLPVLPVAFECAPAAIETDTHS